jgi:hypothetical protein
MEERGGQDRFFTLIDFDRLARVPADSIEGLRDQAPAMPGLDLVRSFSATYGSNRRCW